ncbi:MAG: histidine phosphatase family protein [Caulobacteraceae bacterium]|nr:histidine phosphatase family protein [Caulobacteraceae bacterium]
MACIYLIRHGRPTSTWGGADDDPGLDPAGWSQAEAAAAALCALPPGQRPAQVISSPLRRCRETATPFARAIGAEIQIEPAVGEIPTPAALVAADRPGWLGQAMSGQWSQIVGDLDYLDWRKAVVNAIARRPGAAIFSHFIAINAVLSALAGDPRTVVFRPDHASMTILEAGEEGLAVVRRGREASTQVL